LDEIASIKSAKIELIRDRSMTPTELTALRNHMADRTTTEWFMIVDGDEIYPAHSAAGIAEEIRRVPPTVHRILVSRKHFVTSPNLISGLDAVGRIFRTRKIRFGIASKELLETVGHETPYLTAAPLTPWREYSACLSKDIFFFHCQYLTRSSKDHELSNMRRWRKLPFPILPYFGPWPESFSSNGPARQMTIGLFIRWLQLNAQSFWGRCFKKSFWSFHASWHKNWPRENLLIYDRERGMYPVTQFHD
jgi:hypothetical protein